jgi:hypothetical protein
LSHEGGVSGCFFESFKLLVSRCVWVKVDLIHTAPIAALFGPALRVILAGPFIDRSTRSKQVLVLLRVALVWRHEADGAVPVLVVVPVHQIRGPAARLEQAFKGFDGHGRAVLQRSKQRLRIRVGASSQLRRMVTLSDDLFA